MSAVAAPTHTKSTLAGPRRAWFRTAAAGLAAAAGLSAVGACSGGGGGGGGGGGTTTVKDVAYIRQSRAILTTEPPGLRNLEVLVGTTQSPVTQATSLDASVCMERCAITADKKRIVFLKTDPRTAVTNLYSAPVGMDLVADLSSPLQLNERNHPLANPVFYLLPGTDKVVFGQIEDFGGPGGPDAGETPPTFSVASVSVTGGALFKYRVATFLPSSPIGVSPDGTKILFAETLGAASQLNLYVFDAANPNPSTRPIFQYMVEGSSQFGGEVMTASPSGGEVFVATQVSSEKVIMKVTADGRTQSPPPSRRIGPVECQQAGENEVCLVLSELFPSADGSKLYFLGGREVGVEIVSQLYVMDANLQSAPRPLTSFTTEVLSLAINRARNRVVWATEAGMQRRSNAIFAADLSGTTLGMPTKLVDDPMGGISFHYQEAAFLE